MLGAGDDSTEAEPAAGSGLAAPPDRAAALVTDGAVHGAAPSAGTSSHQLAGAAAPSAISSR